jgi:RNA-directed DNA polymerase
MTKEEYGENLEGHLEKLLKRLCRGAYKPKTARITEIPKEDGSMRPLAVSCFEDRIMQRAVRYILEKIYEPLFLDCSYGFGWELLCCHQGSQQCDI